MPNEETVPAAETPETAQNSMRSTFFPVMRLPHARGGELVLFIFELVNIAF